MIETKENLAPTSFNGSKEEFARAFSILDNSLGKEENETQFNSNMKSSTSINKSTQTLFNERRGVNQTLLNFSKSRRFDFNATKPQKNNFNKGDAGSSSSSPSATSSFDLIRYENFSNETLASNSSLDGNNRLLAKLNLSSLNQKREKAKICKCSICLSNSDKRKLIENKKKNLKFLNSFLQKLNCLNVNSN